MALTLVLFLLLGVRGWRLALATALFWFPMCVIATFLLNRIIPPPLESFGGKDKSDFTTLKIH